jgi:hypothetical protein
MAADVAALRSILFAAAKHFNVQVNPDLQPPSQVDVDFGSIKPRDDSYDEEATIKRQIALIHSKSMLNNVINGLDHTAILHSEWKRTFGRGTGRNRQRAYKFFLNGRCHTPRRQMSVGSAMTRTATPENSGRHAPPISGLEVMFPLWRA